MSVILLGGGQESGQATYAAHAAGKEDEVERHPNAKSTNIGAKTTTRKDIHHSADSESGTIVSYDTENYVMTVKMDDGKILEFKAVDADKASLSELLKFSAGDRIRFYKTHAPDKTVNKMRRGQLATSISFRIRSADDQEIELTPTRLSVTISPLILAIEQIQTIYNALTDSDTGKVRIRSISQSSPLSISLDNAVQATEIIKDIVLPWRKKHSKEIRRLSEQDKQVQMDTMRSESVAEQAQAAKEKLEIDRLKLENERLRIEIQNAKIDLALRVLDKICADLSERQRVSWTIRLLEPLGLIVDSGLDIVQTRRRFKGKNCKA